MKDLPVSALPYKVPAVKVSFNPLPAVPGKKYSYALALLYSFLYGESTTVPLVGMVALAVVEALMSCAVLAVPLIEKPLV